MQNNDITVIQERILKMLSVNSEALEVSYRKLTERKFSIGDTGIPRNILQHWQKESLLPYEYKETGWTRLSLVEFVWLRCMTELRSLGVSQNKIRIIKDKFFGEPIKEYKDYFLSSIEEFDMVEVPDKEKLLAIYRNVDISDKIWKDTFDEMQISYFTLLILQIISYNQNICFTLDKEDIPVGHFE